MKVTELNQNQLDELRQYYNYDVNDSTAIVDTTDVPNSVLFAYYAGIEFNSDDFASVDPEEQDAREINIYEDLRILINY